MPELFISPEFLPAPLPRPARTGLLGYLRSKLAPKLRGQWLDAAAKPVGPAIALPRSKPRPVEFVDEGGRYTIEERPASVTIDAPVPASADRLRITLGANRIVSEIPLAAFRLSARVRPGEEKLFPPAGGSFQIDVLSDRFQSAEDFFGHVQDLYDHWTGSQFPFGETIIKNAFCIRALFWPSDPIEGNFHTPDSAIQTRVLQGNGKLVRSFQQAHGNPSDFALVLIKSGQRAGAGGAVFKNDWQPAWMTVTSEAHEDWRALALHEFGHAFGLADEYDEPPYNLPVTHFEPNVSQHSSSDGVPLPWSKMCADQSKPYPRLFNDPRAVTIVEGARYAHDGWFRPSQDCLMRTPTATFCPVCAEYLGLRILDRLTGPTER